MEFSQQKNSQNSVTSIEKDYANLGHEQIKIPCFISKNYFCETDINNINTINKQTLFRTANIMLIFPIGRV